MGGSFSITSLNSKYFSDLDRSRWENEEWGRDTSKFQHITHISGTGQKRHCANWSINSGYMLLKQMNVLVMEALTSVPQFLKVMFDVFRNYHSLKLSIFQIRAKGNESHVYQVQRDRQRRKLGKLQTQISTFQDPGEMRHDPFPRLMEIGKKNLSKVRDRSFTLVCNDSVN